MKTLTELMELVDLAALASCRERQEPSKKSVQKAIDTRTSVQTGLAEVFAERDALKLAVEAFINYDSTDSDDFVQMMIGYNDTLTKAKAAMKGTS
jgi:hypothetical protein